MTDQAILLLVALLMAHFLGDFTPLATSRMQKAKSTGGPLWLIAAHAAVHAVLVSLAVMVFAWSLPVTLMWAFVLEFSTHFVIDAVRSRASVAIPKLNDPTERLFWTLLGFDQLAHGLVLLAIAAIAL